MYTFDCNKEEALQTYDDVSLAYEKILTQLNLPFVRGELGSNYAVVYNIHTIAMLRLRSS